MELRSTQQKNGHDLTQIKTPNFPEKGELRNIAEQQSWVVGEYVDFEQKEETFRQSSGEQDGSYSF